MMCTEQFMQHSSCGSVGFDEKILLILKNRFNIPPRLRAWGRNHEILLAWINLWITVVARSMDMIHWLQRMKYNLKQIWVSWKTLYTKEKWLFIRSEMNKKEEQNRAINTTSMKPQVNYV